MAGTPRRWHQSWLRHRQRVIGKRSTEYQALRSAGLAGAGTTTPPIDHPCPGREWGRRYHTWRHRLHRWAAIELALLAPTFPKGEGPRTLAQGRSRFCPARLDLPTSGRGASLLPCGDVKANPGPPPTNWEEEDYAVVPDLVAEACGRLGLSPIRDAFATPANHRFPSYWTREDDAFAQPWDFATAGPLWANPPFSRLEEVVAKAAREGCLMLVIAPEWPGPQYPWLAALCALCPKRWELPQDRPVYLPGGTDPMPASRWRTWAFLLDSREGLQAQMPTPALPLPTHQPSAPQCRRLSGIRTLAPNSWWSSATRTPCSSGFDPERWSADGTCHASTQRGRLGEPPPPGQLPKPAHHRWGLRLGQPDTLPPAGGGTSQHGRPSAGETPPGRSRPTEPPGGAHGDRPGGDTSRRNRGYTGRPAGPK